MTNNKKKVLGILGGMGLLATVDLYKKIVLLTAAENDNAHIHTLIDSDTDTAECQQKNEKFVSILKKR